MSVRRLVSTRLWLFWLPLAQLFVILINVTTGCTALDRNAHAEALAQPAGLKREQVATDDFVLTAFARITRVDRPLDVYIEGDGLAWVARNEHRWIRRRGKPRASRLPQRTRRPTWSILRGRASSRRWR
jgi:hypothetical protein